MSEIRPIETKINSHNISNAINNIINPVIDTMDETITLIEYDIELNYNFEEYANMFNGVNMSDGDIRTDLSAGGIDINYFNNYINLAVANAGYGTRDATVAAAIAMVVGYTKYTGKTVNYSWNPATNDNHRRPDPATVGVPEVDEFGLDCSGLVMWSIYNGGYNIPLTGGEVETGNIYNWASAEGYISDDVSTGQPGDFIITRGKGHTALIVGADDTGYWCAEENPGIGATITHYAYTDLGRYCLVDMTEYYNNPQNIRE